MFGIEIDKWGSSIDANFKSLAFLRKGELNAGQQSITCNIDEIVAIRATNSCMVNCYIVKRNGNTVTYEMQIFPATDFRFNEACPIPVPFNRPDGYSLKVEYFVFGSPRPVTGQYGMVVYNANGDIVFSSEHRYLNPIGVSTIRADGQCFGYSEERSNREKYGVILQMSNAFMAPEPQRRNGIRTAQTVIAFEEWRWDRRKIGIYIAPMFIEWGGSTYPLNGNIDTIIVELRGL
nr:MAG TPA: hypothetical protein [Bacteriophage sp.]